MRELAYLIANRYVGQEKKTVIRNSIAGKAT